MYNFHTNGDIFEWTNEGDGEYIGRIDSEGDFRPSDEHEDDEEYVYTAIRLTLAEWANEANQQWEPSAEHFLFAGIQTTPEEWENGWKHTVKDRVLASLSEQEQVHAGIINPNQQETRS